MNNNFIVPAGHNKAVYFLLPLLGLNKFSYGDGDNFLNAYVTYNGEVVAVVKDTEKAGAFTEHEGYLTDFDVDITEGVSGTAIVYKLPAEFHDDFAKFLDGKYSEMSQKAKDTIYKHSGLPYKNTTPGQNTVNTHKLLLVLDRHEVLRKWMETTLMMEIPAGQELLDKPSYDFEFMDINV